MMMNVHYLHHDDEVESLHYDDSVVAPYCSAFRCMKGGDRACRVAAQGEALGIQGTRNPTLI